MKQFIRNKINSLVLESHWYNEIVFRDCRKFWQLKDYNIDVVNLGSSSGTYDFDYSEVDVKGFNWAIAPQSMVGDWAVLKQLRHHLKDGATVIYPFCPFTSISGAVDYIEDRCYTFLDFDLMPNAHFLRKSKIMNLKENPLSSYPLMQLKIDITLRIKGKQSQPILNEKQLQKDADMWIDGWMKQFQLSDLSSPFTGRNKTVYDQSIVMLKGMIDYCEKEKLNFVIVIPPMHRALISRFSPSDRENLIDSFVNKANDYRIPYFNMMDDELFCDDNTLFCNSYFLNEKGAKLFTSYILKKINII